MGRDSREWAVKGSVSRHSSEQDRIDDQLWAEMIERLEEIVKEYEIHPRLIDIYY